MVPVVRKEKSMLIENLPEWHTSRAARVEDAEGAVGLFNACSLDLVDETPHDVDEQRVEWRTPGFDLGRDTRVVLDADAELVGYAEVWDIEEPHVRTHSWGRVHPDSRGRGIGSALLRWEEARAREAIARAPEGTRVSLGSGALVKDVHARELLEANGFEPVRYFRRMVVEMNAPPPEAVWPDGVAVRTFDPEKDLKATVRSVRDTFSDHWGHVDSPFEEELKFWKHWIEEEKDFDPALWYLAEAEGKLVATCLCWPKRHEDPELGWVNVLGVDRGWRRRGLALALLRHAFAAFYARGKRKVGLGVDAASLTGANRLYEKARMKTVRESVSYETELRPGVDLTRRTLEAGGGAREAE
jgi:mycothiol synthase